MPGLTRDLEPNRRHLMMISGGLDSVTLASYCLSKSANINLMLFFDYGHESASREMRAARRASLATDYPIEMVDISGLKFLYHGTLSGDYHPMMAECRTNDYFIFQGIAASVALLRGIERVIVGTIKEDTILHPGLEEFLYSFGESLARLHRNKFMFVTPFIDKTKAEVISIAEQLKVDLSATYGCHTGSAIHCGKCEGCQKRHAAFRSSGFADPTSYLT